MRALSALCFSVFLCANEMAAQPSTDIYVGKLSFSDGRVMISDLKNVTQREGYDNQPHFLAAGSLLFTSIRADGQADTYRYDPASGMIERITSTAESEYSPTPMPGGGTFSVVQVEADSTQRLWHFDFDGGNRGVLLADVKPVGYHAWCDANLVALFVLGDPPTLQLADRRTGKARVVERGIGRSLHKVPGRQALSFVHKVSDDEWWIRALDLSTGDTEPLTPTLPGSEDFAWTSQGIILMGMGARIYQWNPERGDEWEQIADFTAQGLTGITRIAVSPSGGRLAIVASPASTGG